MTAALVSCQNTSDAQRASATAPAPAVAAAAPAAASDRSLPKALAAPMSKEAAGGLFSPDAALGELRARQSEAQPQFKPLAKSLPAMSGLSKGDVVSIYLSQVKSIYGPDDRTDLFEIAATDPVLQDADGVVSLFKASDLRDNGDGRPDDPLSGTVTIPSQTFGERYRLCATERFRDQPSAAYCSGSLVGSNLVLTAGHCIGTGELTTRAVRFVFGYRMTARNTPNLRIPKRDVYEADAIIGRVETDRADWAVVRLKRAVTGHRVLPVARFPAADPDLAKRRIPTGTAVFAIGHPCGLPAKYAPNATVQGNDAAEFFVANLDTYGGNSGSAVFATRNGRHEIVGVLVRGLNDFDFVQGDGCYASVRYRDNQSGEACTRSSEFESLIPAQ